MEQADQDDVDGAIGEIETLSSQDVTENAIEQLNRVDIRDLSDDQIKAYAEAIDSVSYLLSELEEGNELPFGATDD